MERPRFSRSVLVFMIAVPLGWGTLLLFHPNPTQNIHAGLHHQVTPWLVVHLGTLLGIGLIGVVLTLLVRDLRGPAAAISRWAVLPYVLSYGAAEAIQGPATAVLVRYANSVPDDERPTAAAVAVIHTPPPGPVGLACLAAAITWLGWRQRADRADAVPDGMAVLP